MPVHHPARSRYSLEDFHQLGERYAVRYSLAAAQQDDNPCLVQGRIDEHEVGRGITLVSSRLQTFLGYQAQSLNPPCLSIVVLLQGQAQLNGNRPINLSSGDGAVMLCQNGRGQSALHQAQPHLRGLNLSISDPDCLADEHLAEQLRQTLSTQGSRTQRWAVPEHLLQGLEAMTSGQWQGSLQRLLSEGLTLQLLAYGLGALDTPARNADTLSPRDRALLTRVRDHLYQQPGADHSLQQLAQLACMSPSALRHKFQQTYGVSVMGFLRERRMAVAKHCLEQGWRVQDAAHYVGYRHASNFATAYRQHFGVSPRGDA
ncbi:helix-turn-helix transcriptional regulator [Pseudomonas stutzeri]|uniref:helix-turn-helix transcriptional regulator n=1 Tax=Stutzerimonas stutzeri TaxID=316 RepID=UPI0011AF8543|nr:AraC family transcriptional regulator [Stutzerimonas stutzeri]MCQ4297993.1 helix-turn-helix transcriptional regulator [Stutzerimonas stutzeri]